MSSTMQYDCPPDVHTRLGELFGDADEWTAEAVPTRHGDGVAMLLLQVRVRIAGGPPWAMSYAIPPDCSQPASEDGWAELERAINRAWPPSGDTSPRHPVTEPADDDTAPPRGLPSLFESSMAATLATMLDRNLAARYILPAPNEPQRPPPVNIIAMGIRHGMQRNRQQLGELVLAILDTRKPSRFTTYTLTMMKAEGWTPAQVRDVIDDYQALRLELVKCRELIARVFKGEQ